MTHHKALVDSNFLVKHNLGVYKINPEVIFTGEKRSHECTFIISKSKNTVIKSKEKHLKTSLFSQEGALTHPAGVRAKGPFVKRSFLRQACKIFI